MTFASTCNLDITDAIDLAAALCPASAVITLAALSLQNRTVITPAFWPSLLGLSFRSISRYDSSYVDCKETES
ncbi:hypothetical protein PILCRDRAFT_814712 [Piloderma croceum F 1598]|uniref:Uncharacterized protein n=1 Tax=Piloderma croceum (strain F 1598) TaxID=765440 RepID=A0A0C3FUG2_PILCF|nr:hypothetical protein PILCRDRAFT_814712 [Piloderma croceum F 1598]